jgi:hypothetical protein
MSTPPNTRTAGRSTTQPQAPVKTIPILSPEDTNYLCQKICFCSINAKIGKVGQFLYQRCVTKSIQFDCEASGHIWRYKGEVGYNMKLTPPKPLLGKNGIHPSSFPLGAAIREKVFSLSKQDLESGPQIGLLRIPDVIIVKDKSNFSLEQSNIEMVVEIKFPRDTLKKGQQIAYEKIAGNKNKFKLLETSECQCKPREEKKRQPVDVPAPLVAPIPKPGRRTAGEPATANALGENEVPLSDYLLAGGLIVGGVAIAYFTAGTGSAISAAAWSSAARLFVVGAAVGASNLAAAQGKKP